MKKIRFWKMSGSGNDFVLIDNRRCLVSGDLSRLAQKLCHRQEGIGADGLLLLEKSQKASFRMAYFNADGSRAPMCGNGARCIAWLARNQHVVGSRFTFETDRTQVKAIVQGMMVEITLADAVDYRPHLTLRARGKTFPVSVINTGVPHAVCFVPRVGTVNVEAEGQTLRFHSAFKPDGANVNFVQRLGARTLEVRTYERGVERETLACGTGVAASAIVGALKGLVQAPVYCRTAGGDRLEVGFELHPSNARRPATNVSLRGPVRFTFKGVVYV
jgi:diaminopimelate epimerase